jgi:hypothetical protein
MKTWILAAICMMPLPALAQCAVQVLHTSGTQVYGGTAVTVTQSGLVDVNNVYCADTRPFMIGYEAGFGSGTGAYHFTFDPPLDSARLNVSGVSGSFGHQEEVWLYVNGAHYAIPEPGSPQGCDPMAVLTPNGNIGPCINCTVSGWGGTVIPGPITTFTVLDTVLSGTPAGAIFSLFMCAQLSTGVPELEQPLPLVVYPDPVVDQLALQSGTAVVQNVSISDMSGREVLRMDGPGSGNIDVAHLLPGQYVLVAITNQGTARARFLKW